MKQVAKHEKALAIIEPHIKEMWFIELSDVYGDRLWRELIIATYIPQFRGYFVLLDEQGANEYNTRFKFIPAGEDEMIPDWEKLPDAFPYTKSEVLAFAEASFFLNSKLVNRNGSVIIYI